MKTGELFKAPNGARLHSRRVDHDQVGILLRRGHNLTCIEFERYCLIIRRPILLPVESFIRTLEWIDLDNQDVTFEEMCRVYAPRPNILDSNFNAKALDWIYRYAEDILTAQEDAAWTCQHAEDFRDMAIRGALNGFESPSTDEESLEEYYRGEGHGGLSRVFIQIDLSPGQFLMLSRYKGRLGYGVRITYHHNPFRSSTYLCIEDKDPEQGREFLVYDVDEYDEPIDLEPLFTKKPLRHRYV
jgi:hypothetical protein